MKTPVVILSSVVVAAALTGGIWHWNSRSESPSNVEAPVESRSPKKTSLPQAATAPATTPATSPKSSGNLEARIASLEAKVATLQKTTQARGVDGQRVAALENTVKTLQGAMDGVSIEKASADRHALFSGDDGHLKANEYFEAGKFAIAAEGYLTFIESHPGHPDTREVMKKARDAFTRAGYKDKAFWVQGELINAFPEHAPAEIHELAVLEKNAGRYDLAADHMAQAADLAPSVEDRLWKRLYWAWYVQLRDGTPAGIAALQQVQREIATSGVTNPKLNEHAAKRMQEWQQQMAKK